MLFKSMSLKCLGTNNNLQSYIPTRGLPKHIFNNLSLQEAIINLNQQILPVPYLLPFPQEATVTLLQGMNIKQTHLLATIFSQYFRVKTK